MVGPHKTFRYYLYLSTPTHLYTSKDESGTTNTTDLYQIQLQQNGLINQINLIFR